MSHPHIVSFIACDKIGSNQRQELFLVMEYIEGMNLKEWLKLKGPFSYAKLVPIFLDLCVALAYLHQKKVFHFDLKPENILITRDEKIFLADFGIAAIQSGNGSTVPLVDPIGSLEYSAPEQLKGETPDGRSDLYALGMILYALLHGKGLFEKVEKQVIWGELVYDSTPFNLTFPEETPSFFRNILKKLVSKASSDRYPDVETLLHQFHRNDSTPKAPIPRADIKAELPNRRFSEKWVIPASGALFVLILFLNTGLKTDRVVLPSVALQPAENVRSGEPNGHPMIGPSNKSMTIGAEPVIEILFLKKEDKIGQAGGPAPANLLNDEELERFLFEFKTNAENKDLDALREMIQISPDVISHFQKVIETKSNIKADFLQIKREGPAITVHVQLFPDQNPQEETLTYLNGKWVLYE